MAAVGILYGRGDARRYETNPATRETDWVKWLILTAALTFFLLFLLMPLIMNRCQCKMQIEKCKSQNAK